MNAHARHVVAEIVPGGPPPVNPRDQHRPVVVIPRNPVGVDASMPWPGGEA